SAGRRPGEAAARAGDRPLPAPGQQPRAAGPGARRQRHQCRPARPDPRGPVPRGPVLPAQRDRTALAAAGRTRRRRAAAGAPFPAGGQAVRRRRPACATGACVAQQRARAAQRGAARGAACRGRNGRRGRPRPARIRRGRGCGGQPGRARPRDHRRGAGTPPGRRRASRRRTGAVAARAVPAHGTLRPPTRPTPTMRLRQRIPLSRQLGALALLYLLAGATLAVVLARWLAPVYAALLATALLAPLLLYHARQLFAPINALSRALAGSVASFRDGDFSFNL